VRLYNKYAHYLSYGSLLKKLHVMTQAYHDGIYLEQEVIK